MNKKVIMLAQREAENTTKERSFHFDLKEGHMANAKSLFSEGEYFWAFINFSCALKELDEIPYEEIGNEADFIREKITINTKIAECHRLSNEYEEALDIIQDTMKLIFTLDGKCILEDEYNKLTELFVEVFDEANAEHFYITDEDHCNLATEIKNNRK
ncbi:hypothetical protein ACFL4D_02595 [Candidatus Margulisiibacteriota bacterium]